MFYIAPMTTRHLFIEERDQRHRQSFCKTYDPMRHRETGFGYLGLEETNAEIALRLALLVCDPLLVGMVNAPADDAPLTPKTFER